MRVRCKPPNRAAGSSGPWLSPPGPQAGVSAAAGNTLRRTRAGASFSFFIFQASDLLLKEFPMKRPVNQDQALTGTLTHPSITSFRLQPKYLCAKQWPRTEAGRRRKTLAHSSRQLSGLARVFRGGWVGREEICAGREGLGPPGCWP